LVPSGNRELLWFVVPILALFQGLAQANSTALISKSGENDQKGQILGINSSIQAMAQTIPSIIAGFVDSGTGILKAELPLIIALIVMTSAGILFVIFQKSETKKTALEVEKVKTLEKVEIRNNFVNCRKSKN